MSWNREKILKSFINNKEVLEKRNAEGIEKYRKGKFTLKFSNATNQKITVKQIKHKFLFGCSAFMLNSKTSPTAKATTTNANNCGISPYTFAVCIIPPRLFAVFASTSAETMSFKEKESAAPDSRKI